MRHERQKSFDGGEQIGDVVTFPGADVPVGSLDETDQMPRHVEVKHLQISVSVGDGSSRVSERWCAGISRELSRVSE